MLRLVLALGLILLIGLTGAWFSRAEFATGPETYPVSRAYELPSRFLYQSIEVAPTWFKDWTVLESNAEEQTLRMGFVSGLPARFRPEVSVYIEEASPGWSRIRLVVESNGSFLTAGIRRQVAHKFYRLLDRHLFQLVPEPRVVAHEPQPETSRPLLDTSAASISVR